jgi:hypothetical protein
MLLEMEQEEDPSTLEKEAELARKLLEETSLVNKETDPELEEEENPTPLEKEAELSQKLLPEEKDPETEDPEETEPTDPETEEEEDPTPSEKETELSSKLYQQKNHQLPHLLATMPLLLLIVYRLF